MAPEQLEPRLELLREEYVLVQAWKKTASYIRYHNWFSDTLALDRAAVNLPTFLGELRERLQAPETWRNDPLRIVPAPKRQHWRVREGAWEPVKGAPSARLRPLAHVSLEEQVVATALMLCLADRVETRQGDPWRSVRDPESRRQVVSYGNRLFCDAVGSELRHRWGSSKLYRAYYQDYRTFLSRPEIAAEAVPAAEEKRVYVVHADLRQFYDRVRPDLLSAAIGRVRRDGDNAGFFSLAASVLDWRWDPRDGRDVRIYAGQAELEDFTRVALPQGLVSAGFFANVALLSFDEALRAAIGTEIAFGIRLVDSCRYVDDLRILVAVDRNSATSSDDLETAVSSVSRWLSRVLQEHAPGLALSPEKTQAAALGGDERPLVRQSAKMNRIQSAVSGGFDALGGEEILDAIQGLMRAQEALSVGDDSGWRFSPVPDVRNETVARFGAARYRTTFRSIRPLLQDDDTPDESEVGRADTAAGGRLRVARTRRELDEDARAFALGLIQRWIDDPSNVRLLRIGLDLWPDVKLLQEVLSLLRPFTETGGRRNAPRRVAWYCLAEVLRAGATETGLVADTESLPAEGFRWVEQGIEEARTQIGRRIAALEKRRGSATCALILPLPAKRPTATNANRPLRACVVQAAVPAADDFRHTDLALNESAIRRRHRNHLSAALAAVERMLALRETHKESEGRLDWLILPELAVHPNDVRTHLVPFARAHRALILTGLTYEEVLVGQPLVNSALWIIPEWSDAYGLQIRTRRQGKAHLAPNEQAFNGAGARILQGFRPCQWLIGYPWSDAEDAQPAWLTAAVCYDATDLGLAADLRDESDILAIPALNQDVKTFDQMALALHYHMFQLVVVANNGQYGGSNAYWPRKDVVVRQVFHTHGQPQASISFLEIDDIGAFLERHDGADWKHPPAGLNRR